MYCFVLFIYLFRLTIMRSFELFILSFYIQAKIREKKLRFLKGFKGIQKKKCCNCDKNTSSSS